MAVILVFGFTLANGQEQVISVAKDGTGDYLTVQEAIDAVRAFNPTPVAIHIKAGIYKEKLVIPSWISNLTIKGDEAENTILTFDDYSGKGDINTFTSYTLLVQGDGITMQNLTVENSEGLRGQAVALHVEGDRFIASNCRIVGNQDTFYAGKANSRQLFDHCYIEGTTDFIFGPSTVVFNNCTIHSKKHSYITAASTTESQEYGFVFLNCKLTAAENITKVYLGRPWRDFAKTVFINTEMGSHIRPEGWHNWSRPEAEQTTFYAEYGSSGPGANGERVGWANKLGEEDLKNYTIEKVLAGCDDWQPATVTGGRKL